MAIFLLLSAIPACAQKRNPDLILTVKKDTLSAFITEVGISDLKYRNLSGDTSAIHTITKADVIRVLYGNGDEEEFKPVPTPVTQLVPIDRRYYKMIVKTPFQKEIAQWPTDKLRTQKDLYKERYISQKSVGIAAFPIGGILFAVGFVQILSSVFSFSNTKSDTTPGSIAMVSGIVATGIGIPLSIASSKSKKKYKAIEMELEMRDRQPMR